jgi:hypothetical protein
MTPLQRRRNELLELERQEREGASFWSVQFPEATRNRLHLVMRGASGGSYSPLLDVATNLLLHDLGQLSLFPPARSSSEDLYQYLAECPDDMVPSVIEAFGEGYVRQFQINAQQQAYSQGRLAEEPLLPVDAQYVSEINRVLGEDRIAFENVDGQMIPFASRELHVEVVQPILQLLSTPGWEKVESSYQDALSQLAQGEGANAITDAGTALQGAFERLGAKGNQLGDLITSAKSLKILASQDLPLLDAIERACRWVSADRSNFGDSHNADPAHTDDAWFTIHVVGAIVLRLASGKARVR